MRACDVKRFVRIVVRRVDRPAGTQLGKSVDSWTKSFPLTEQLAEQLRDVRIWHKSLLVSPALP